MQLKIKRSQRDGGVISTAAIFCLDARVQFTDDEQRNITRYKLGGQTIYNSEASRRLIERSDRQNDGSTRGALRSIASLALAALKLNISINSLARGQRVECKSLDELMAAEGAIMEACENLKSYLDTAATFDGREVLFDYASGSAMAVASSATPAPMLMIESQQSVLSGTVAEPHDTVEADQWRPYDRATTEQFDAPYEVGRFVRNAAKKVQQAVIKMPSTLRSAIVVFGILLICYRWFVYHPALPME